MMFLPDITFKRILRSGLIRLKRLKIGLAHKLSLVRPSNLELRVFPWHPDAGVPGSQAYLPWGNNWQHEEKMKAFADEVISHYFRVFTEQPLDVSVADSNRKALITKYCHGVDQNLLDSYMPIDWHSDFHSGYRWSPHLFFQDVKIAPLPGVDIKVPRELSRFQHVGALAFGDQERSALEFMLQVTDWIIANPYGRGVNWECSMDIALRAINWIWGLRFFEPQLSKYLDFQQLIANSLRDHGRHVYENLDYYGKNIPTGNHYLADIAGLLYIGAVLPDLPEADLWLAFGIQELVSEMHREVLSDGMCYEASTSYHRLVAELFVSCAALIERLPASRRQRLVELNISQHQVQPPLGSIAERNCNLTSQGQILPQSFYSRLGLMAEFSLAMRKPNGFVFQIGDNDSARVHKLIPSLIEETRNHDHLFSTIGELLGREDLIQAGHSARLEGKLVCGGVSGNPDRGTRQTSLPSSMQLFPKAGIATHTINKAWLGVSCGPSGKGGRGGHGHNDKNSFELNVNRLDFVVDGGCPAYTAAPGVRNWFRSTAVHSTIHVLNVEQNIWPNGMNGLFRLPENAAPILQIDSDEIIEGTHKGYGASHKRRFYLLVDRLVIDDEFIDDRERYLVFNLHPKVLVTRAASETDSLSVQLQHSKGTSVHLDIKGGASLEVLPGAFGIGYMRAVENQRLCIRLSTHHAQSIFSW